MAISPTTSAEVTNLLIQWGNGDAQALDKLMPLVYEELRTLARQHLRREHPGQTLQTADLVHEAYLKLVNQRRVRWQNRAHFYAIAAQLMRRILVDRARMRKRAKRGGGAAQVSLSQETLMAPEPSFDFVAFDEALEELARIDPRKAKIVELRFFGGLSVDETAEFLDISAATVMRDWRMAKAWLHKALNPEPTRFAAKSEPDDSPDRKSTRR
jgi:RNA polymerase sigma factor (TIGR02999 family)